MYRASTLPYVSRKHVALPCGPRLGCVSPELVCVFVSISVTMLLEVLVVLVVLSLLLLLLV